MFQARILTRRRIWAAYGFAVVADAAQWVLGPLGFAAPDELIDIVAGGAIWWALGFHPLLLPTFVLEFVPFADLLPTWTGCVAVVVAIRKRQGNVEPPPPGDGTVIDV
jgi:hypothetical protein